jgi:hypothetical protein
VNLQDAVGKVVDALDRADIPYMLVGSFSSMFYSFPRSTTDSDFVLGVTDPDLPQLAKLLGSDFRIDPQLAFEAAGGSLKNELAVVGTPFRIELFRLTEAPFDQSRFARRKLVQLAGQRVWIQTAEDVIIQKLLWNRPKDREDVIGVIAVNQHTLDRAYLHTWCDRLNLREPFNGAWQAATTSN